MIANAIQHLMDFIEKPHPVVANMPLCPFARQARIKNRLRFEVLDFTNATDVMPLIQSMSREHDLMQILHPGEMTCVRLYEIAEELNLKLPGIGLQAFCGHPEDTFNIAGVYTRREPYPTLQVIWQDVAQAAENRLSKKYYQNWKEENYEHTLIHPTPLAPGSSTP